MTTPPEDEGGVRSARRVCLGRDLVDAAGEYVGSGIFVLLLQGVDPLGHCTCHVGSRCAKPGKHPVARLTPHGVRDASRYWPTVERWLRIRREVPTNIAWACGASGVVAVDNGPRNGGDVAVVALQEAHGSLPGTLTAETGGGGTHHVYLDPNQTAITEVPYAGIDLQRGGKIIVVAPSVHASGRRYRWVDPTTPIAPAPEWLLRPEQA